MSTQGWICDIDVVACCFPKVPDVTDVLIPYLISILAALLMLFIVGLAYLEMRRRTKDLISKEAKLPDAVRFMTLAADVENLKVVRDELRDDADNAREILSKADNARQWLNQNHALYEKISQSLPAIESRLSIAKTDFEDASKKADQASLLLLGRTTELRKAEQDFQVKQRACKLIDDEIAGRRKTLDSLESEIHGRQEWLNENQLLYAKISQELPAMEARLSHARSEFDEAAIKTEQANMLLLGRVTEVRQAEQELQVQERTRKLVDGEITDRRKTLDAMQGEIRAKQEEWSQLQASQQTLMSEIGNLTTKKDSAAEDFSKFERDLDSIVKTLERTEERNRELDADINDKMDNLKLIDKQVKRLDEERLNIERLIVAAEKRWAQVSTTVGAADGQRLAELWSPALKKSQFARRRKLNENGEISSLTAMQEYMVAAGLQYHERMLYQFHTSLKVAEMSPLVVLAGISGTGKSELPRRYAEGMGMHVLTLPVQPRWDSPQDMFGFYNYLENRYRATELARALVQMDRFVDERKAEWNFPQEWKEHSLRDRMLIVLLDEMNLARVEYYFSEFLSRLETRRGIDRSDPDQRRKAEIMLEVGIQTIKKEGGKVEVQQQPTLPIFVDRNVLFVGTMNEDETTQTLSDKVVDRANVLRFGRPSSLKSKASDESFEGAKAFLAYEDWQSWIKNSDTDLSQSIRSDVTEWVQKLNQAMHRIGRPFAHRTYGAILSYVANYPQQENFRLAVADQIEMKVLPKLRGLDPHDPQVGQALGEIQSVINSLGDEKLQSAIQESRGADSHQFLWHGVDRVENS